MKLRRRMENDLERDIREHIEMETRDNIERGMSPDDARNAALRKFGNVLRVLVMKIALSGSAYRTAQQQVAYFQEVRGRLGGMPGAVAAGTIYSPVRGVVEIEGAPPAPPDRMPGGFTIPSPQGISARWEFAFFQDAG